MQAWPIKMYACVSQHIPMLIKTYLKTHKNQKFNDKQTQPATQFPSTQQIVNKDIILSQKVTATEKCKIIKMSHNLQEV